MERDDLSYPDVGTQGEPDNIRSRNRRRGGSSTSQEVVPINPGWSQVIARALEISSAPDAKGDGLSVFLAETVELLSASAASLYLYTPTRELRHEASYGLSNRVARRIEEELQAESARRFLTTQYTPVVLEDVRDVPGDIASNVSATRTLDLIAEAGLVTLATFPMVAQSNLLGFLSIYHGTRRSYSEVEIEDLTLLAGVLAMALMNKRLADSRKIEDKGRDQFISALSHELRTPLTSIIGFTQIIRRKLANKASAEGRMAEHVDIIWAQAQRLNRLIDTFVDIANIEQGDFSLKFGKVELVSVLKSAIEQTVARLSFACPVDVKVPDSPVWLRGDSQRLEQVFCHIVANALRYSPPESAVVITCVVREAEGEVAISVSDQGPGISEDLRGAIFERFYQAEAVRSGGLGVGLYLSKTIVEAHGGQIAVESNGGAGTTISVTLPL